MCNQTALQNSTECDTVAELHRSHAAAQALVAESIEFMGHAEHPFFLSQRDPEYRQPTVFDKINKLLHAEARGFHTKHDYISKPAWLAMWSQALVNYNVKPEKIQQRDLFASFANKLLPRLLWYFEVKSPSAGEMKKLTQRWIRHMLHEYDAPIIVFENAVQNAQYISQWQIMDGLRIYNNTTTANIKLKNNDVVIPTWVLWTQDTSGKFAFHSDAYPKLKDHEINQGVAQAYNHMPRMQRDENWMEEMLKISKSVEESDTGASNALKDVVKAVNSLAASAKRGDCTGFLFGVNQLIDKLREFEPLDRDKRVSELQDLCYRLVTSPVATKPADFPVNLELYGNDGEVRGVFAVGPGQSLQDQYRFDLSKCFIFRMQDNIGIYLPLVIDPITQRNFQLPPRPGGSDIMTEDPKADNTSSKVTHVINTLKSRHSTLKQLETMFSNNFAQRLQIVMSLVMCPVFEAFCSCVKHTISIAFI